MGRFVGSAQIPNVRPFMHIPKENLFGSTGSLSFSTAPGSDSQIVSSIGITCWTFWFTFGGASTNVINLKAYDWDGTTFLQTPSATQLLAATGSGPNFIIFGQTALAAGGGYTNIRQWAPYFSMQFIATAGTDTVTGMLVGTNP